LNALNFHDAHAFDHIFVRANVGEFAIKLCFLLQGLPTGFSACDFKREGLAVLIDKIDFAIGASTKALGVLLKRGAVCFKRGGGLLRYTF
jgi:hypothetical protein